MPDLRFLGAIVAFGVVAILVTACAVVAAVAFGILWLFGVFP